MLRRQHGQLGTQRLARGHGRHLRHGRVVPGRQHIPVLRRVRAGPVVWVGRVQAGRQQALRPTGAAVVALLQPVAVPVPRQRGFNKAGAGL